jgi:hypothetical protein
VAWQREVLSKDPLEGIRHLGTALRLVGAVMTVLSALLAIGVAMDGGGRAGEKSLVGAAITVAFALAWLAGVLVRRAFARRDLPSDPAAAMWGEDAVSSASATAEAIQTGQTAAPDRHMAGRVRSWLRRTGTAILGVVAGVTAALCFFMLFVRKPGRRSPERVFSTGGEDGIDLFWRFLVVVGLTTMCAFVLGWLTVLAIDAWSTRVLWVRARRADADTERPSEHVLRSVLDSQAVSLRLGRSLVAAATVAGSMAGSMPSVEPGDLFDIEARTAAAGVVSAAATWCRLSAVFVAVGVALIVAGVSVERRWREQIRSVWPIAERSASDVRA